MSDHFTIHCPSCQAEYELPEALRDSVRGKSLTCESCAGSWVPLPVSGALSMLRQARELPIDLMPYLKTASELFTLSDLEPGPAASSLFADPVAEPSPAAAAPVSSAPVAPAVPPVPSLRVVARGPGIELDAAYRLGRRSYLIGKSGGHLVLPLAAIPDRAIRVRSAAEDGLTFEGLGGFDVPLGPISVQAGRIRPGTAGLTLNLAPYQVVLEVSDAPGEAIADLEGSTTEPGTGTLPQADHRAQLKPPAPAAADLPVNPQMTVRDLGAHTAGTAPSSWSSGDVFRGFEVGLVGMEGPYQGKSFRLTKGVTLIGRTSGDLVIPDKLISGKHAQLEVLGPGQYALKDFASTNGTTVNDRPIAQTGLRNGDVIGFGGVKFKFIAGPKT